jgi:probable HAF family extracellular repeat protein
MLKAPFHVAAVGLLLAFAIPPAASAAMTYALTDLGTLGGAGSHAWAINNLGQVVGEAQDSAGAWHAFLWDARGGMQDLGTMSYGSSVARAINDDGVVVGSATGSASQAFVWTEANGMQPLLPHQYSSDAWGINSAGHIVGYGQASSSSAYQAFLYKSASSVANLGSYGALGVNDNDVSVGEIPDPTGAQAGRGALWVGASMTQLPASTYQARGINANKWVVGRTLDYPGVKPAYGFVWDANNGLRTIGTSASLSSVACSINDLGEVVGAEESGSGSWPWYALVWDPNTGSTHRLDALIDIATSTGGEAWRTCDAVDVNNSGEIVGDGYTVGMSGSYDTLHAILLEPEPIVSLPEPASLTLLVVGVAALAGRKARAKRGGASR